MATPRRNDAHDKMKKPCTRHNFGLKMPLLVLVFIMIHKVQAADVLDDLIKSLASNGASCLVMVADKWTSSDYLNDDNHIPMTFIDSSISSSRVESVLPQGIHPVNDCSHYLLWFKDANGTLIFLDRCDNSAFKVQFQMNHNQIVSDTSSNWGFLQGVNSSPI